MKKRFCCSWQSDLFGQSFGIGLHLETDEPGMKTFSRKLHYVFDTGNGGIMERARFWGSEGSFEPSCEVGYDPGIFYGGSHETDIE